MASGVVGRDQELRRIDAAVSEGRFVVVDGQAGIGKTTLWAAALDCLAARDVLVLRAAPAAAESHLPLGALADLLEAVAADAMPRLPEPQRRALARALLLERPTGESDPRALASAVLNSLRTMSTDRTVVVAIDDVQWLDPETEEVLRFAFRRLGDARVAGLLARRTARPQPLPLGLDAVPRSVEHVVLGPLSLGAAGRMLIDQLGLQLPRPTLARVHEAAGGNPLHTIEIGQALAERGVPAPTAELPLPATLENLVEDRVAALPLDTRRALLVAALAPSRPIELLRQTVGGTVLDQLAPAADAGFVVIGATAVRFTHPLYAAAVETCASPAERAAAHLALADATADPVVAARHLALGRSDREAELAERLEVAADEARHRGASTSAAELFQLAAERTPDDDVTAFARRVVRGCDLLVNVGDIPTAHAIAGDALARVAAGPPRAALLAFQIRWLAFPPDVAEEVAREAIGCAGDDAAALADVWLSLCIARGIYGDFLSSGKAAMSAEAFARRAGIDVLLVHALGLHAITDLITGAADPAGYLKQGLEAEARVTPQSLYHAPSTMLALARLRRDDLEGARDGLEQRLRVVTDLGDELARAQMLLNLAELELRSGRVGRAREHADSCMTVCEQAALMQSGAFFYVRALVAAHLGQVDQARADAEEGLSRSLAIHDVIFTALSRAVLGFLAVSTGRFDEAARVLRATAADLQRAGERHSPLFDYRGDLVEALLGLGEVPEAAHIVAELEAGADASGRTSLRVQALRSASLLASARGELVAAVKTSAEAVALAGDLPMPFERARTGLVHGAVLRRTGQRKAAREHLEAAHGAFDALGAVLWSERCRLELARIGGRMVPAGALTESEQQVAERAAAGRTNAEIAAELHISVKTVEANLSRIYRKLSVRSRTELATALRQGEGFP